MTPELDREGRLYVYYFANNEQALLFYGDLVLTPASS